MITNGLGILTDTERTPEVLPTGRTMPTEEFIANGLVHLGPLLASEGQTPEIEGPAGDNEADRGLNKVTKKFLGRFVEGDIDRLTVDDLGMVTQAVIQANKPNGKYIGRPQREDINDIISSATEGVDYVQMAALYGLTVSEVYQQLYRIGQRVIKNQGGKLTVEDLLGIERPSGLTSDTPPEQTPPRETVPDDWFLQPKTLKAFSLRQVDIDRDNPLAWQDDALCAQTDPEAFFPEKGGSTREAKKICTTCEVKGECLEYALEHDERFGIWGGLSERERRRLRKSRT